MAQFIKNYKIRKYKELSDAVKAARKHLLWQEQNMTVYYDVYDLDGENKCDGCINKYNRVRLANGQINDDGGVTIRCEHLLDNKVFCDDCGCDMAKQMDRFAYAVAKRDLDDAIAARRAFVKNLFRLKQKSK